jgi:hypothetical protein
MVLLSILLLSSLVILPLSIHLLQSSGRSLDTLQPTPSMPARVDPAAAETMLDVVLVKEQDLIFIASST